MPKSVIKNGLTIVFLVTIFFNVSAQVNISFDSSPSYDDNIYLSPEKIGDFTIDNEIKLSYLIKSDSRKSFLSLYNNSNYISYIKYSEKSLFLNNLGFAYVNIFGKNKKQKFYFGSNWSLRKNRSEYNYYDYNQFYSYANWQFNINKTFLKAGYNFRYRSYADLSNLTNSQHYVFAQLNRSFKTRTSIILETDFGYKSFRGTNTYTTINTGHGKNITPRTVVTGTTSPAMSHIIILGRVAQSLTKKIGVFVQYRKQISLTDATNYVNLDSFSLNEELFDEPFSYSSSGVTSKLTFLLSKSSTLQFGGFYTKKDYISEHAYISSADTVRLGDIRNDKKKGISFNLSKSFYPKTKHIKSIKTFLNYSYVNNWSNSYWYNYNNNSVSMGVSIFF